MTELNTRKDLLLKAIEDARDTCISMATGGTDFSYENYENQRANLLSYPELKKVTPDWLISNRYGSGYWRFIKQYADNYADRRTFLRGEFDDMTDYVKSGMSMPTATVVVPAIENFDSAWLMKNWLKIIERANNDPEGAITASKSLVETTIKKILELQNIKFTKRDDLPELYKKLKANLKLDPRQYRKQTVKQILSGIASVIQGFSALRNDYSDAHGKGSEDLVPGKEHAQLVINLAGTLCAFLIDLHLTRNDDDNTI